MKRRIYINERGFTAFEIIIVMVIVGILAAVSVPRITSLIKTHGYLEARQIVAEMRYTRTLAITSAKDHRLRFITPPSGASFTEYRIERLETDWEQVGEIKYISEDTICIDPDNPGINEKTFTFNHLGEATINPDNPGIQRLTLQNGLGGTLQTINVIAATGRAYEE